MKTIINIFVILLVGLICGSCYARPIRTAFFLGSSNSNLTETSGGLSGSVAMDWRPGVGLEVNFPVTDQIDITPGFAYFIPASGPDFIPRVKIGVSPIYLNGKVHFGENMGETDLYLGGGINYSLWELVEIPESISGSVGFQFVFGVNISHMMVEAGYISMNGTSSQSTNMASSGAIVKAGLIF